MAQSPSPPELGFQLQLKTKDSLGGDCQIVSSPLILWVVVQGYTFLVKGFVWLIPLRPGQVPLLNIGNSCMDDVLKAALFNVAH